VTTNIIVHFNYVVLSGSIRVFVAEWIDTPTFWKIWLMLVAGLVEVQPFLVAVPSVEKYFDGSEAICCIAEHELIVVVSLQVVDPSS
jgi:hypothetical protein